MISYIVMDTELFIKITNIIMCCLYRLMSKCLFFIKNVLGSDISTQGSRPVVYSGHEWIRVITKLPNSEQSYKGKVKTHKYINRHNQSTTGKLWKP
jgi:hypothetical protein